MLMNRVLGIDPGSRITGYGIVDYAANRLVHVASGQLKLTGASLPVRLQEIFVGLRELVVHYKPAEVALEKVFMHQNVDSALKLGHARGVAMVAATAQALEVYEYSATQVKQATTGRGRASKEQVQHMIRILLRLDHIPLVDASDALAVAVCHSHLITTHRYQYRTFAAESVR